MTIIDIIFLATLGSLVAIMASIHHRLGALLDRAPNRPNPNFNQSLWNRERAESHDRARAIMDRIANRP